MLQRKQHLTAPEPDFFPVSQQGYCTSMDIPVTSESPYTSCACVGQITQEGYKAMDKTISIPFTCFFLSFVVLNITKEGLL